MIRAKVVTISVFIFLLTVSFVQAQGPLVPPGTPGETMKSLTQIYDQATSAVQAADGAAQAANSAVTAATIAQDDRTAIRNPRLLPVGADALYTISQPGSYYLAENIIGWTGKSGVKITTGSVTLDLNGFSLIGVPTSTNGIFVTGGSNYIIKNGTIRNWGLSGINSTAASMGLCENVLSASNGYIGFYLGAHCKAIRCTGSGNANTGFFNLAPGGIFEECNASSNGNNGITLEGGIATNCVSNNNTNNGFNLGKQGILRSCNSHNNKQSGIYVVFDQNVVSGCTATSNTASGIVVGGMNNEIKENVCVNNGFGLGGAGIHVTTGNNNIDGNTVKGSDYGVRVTSAGNLIVRNISRNNTATFQISAGNGSVPVTSPETATNPWGNIVY